MTEEKKDDILKINKNENDENSARRGNYLNI
jgi:hypothetical protein